MTERIRVEKTYEKARKLFPYITNEADLNQIAIKLERRRVTWVCTGFLWASVLFFIIFVILVYYFGDEEAYGTIGFFSLIFFVVTLFEYFRTILNAVKIKSHYMEASEIKNQGTLTYNRIGKDNREVSKFKNIKIVKAILYDKDDSDNSSVSFIYHKYYLYFKLNENFSTAGFRVKRTAYLKAPLDAEYILILSDSGKVMAAYPANAWEIDGELYEKCEFDASEHNNMLEIPDEKLKNTESKNNNIVQDILLLIINLLSVFFLPIILILLHSPFTMFFATKSAVQNKKILPIINVILGYFMLIGAVLSICVIV